LKRTVEPQCGHLARTVSSFSHSYSFCFNHMSWKHLGQLRTCVVMIFPLH
jgi:hypothetical protein